MRPDDEMRELEQLLSAAGERARTERGGAPDADYARALRSELLTDLGTSPAAVPARPRGRGRRLLRLVPLALAAVLMTVAVVGARELYVAIADRPTPTPAPTAAPTVVPTPSVKASAEPTGVPTSVPTLAPSPEPTRQPTPEPTPELTAKPTPKPTLEPTPEPTPVPIGDLSLSAVGCNGGVVLGWSQVHAQPFTRYVTLRSLGGSIPAAYPPQDGITVPGGTASENPEVTGAVDPSAPLGSTAYYRTLALSSENAVLAVSPVVAATSKPVKALGALGVGPGLEGGVHVEWTPYGGLVNCFSYYKVVVSETHTQPTYGEDGYLAALENQAASSWSGPAGDLLPGHTYHFRVQAIRVTPLGWLVTAQTEVATYTIPAG